MIVVGAVLAVAAAVMCFLPLFGLLGYESAAATGAVAGSAVMVRTARLLDRESLTLTSGSRAESPTRLYFRLLLQHLGLLLIPALLLAANALRVQNCDMAAGARFWLVIPPGAVLMGQTVAWGAGAVLPRWRWLGALLVLLAEVGRFLWRFAWYPPITGHEWMIGYFSGSIYDEALRMPTSLLWFRVLGLGGAACVVLAVELLWRWRRGLEWGPAAAALGVCLLAVGGLHSRSFSMGIVVTRDDAVRTLGATLETEHFLIHYDPASIPQSKRPLMAEDHEFYYDRHVAWFGVDVVQWRGGRKLESFIYPNRETQQRLLGSRKTLVARPWTGQMHIRWSDYAEGGVGHEMAHLFSAAFGGGPLELPVQGPGGLIVNVGLLEGIAEAADWPAEELPAHYAAAAMKQLDMAPPLRKLLNPAGFWSQPSQRAYTIAGSFVRYLVDTYGIDRFKQAYGTGDFAAAYGRPVGDLIQEWQAFRDTIPLTEDQLALAEFYYRRGSIFERVCARTIGELKRKAENAQRRGDTGRAVALWQEIVAFEPGGVGHRLSLADALAADQQQDAALALLDEVLAEDGLSPAARAGAVEQQGDLRWRAGQPAAAALAYTEALSTALPAGTTRRLTAKSVAAADPRPEVVALAARYFLEEESNRATALYAALQWAELAPEAALPRYLAGLQLSQLGQWADALPWLLAAEDLPHPLLIEQRDLMLAQDQLLLWQLPEAQARYTAVLERADTSLRGRRQAEEGLERVAWRMRRPIPPPTP